MTDPQRGELAGDASTDDEALDTAPNDDAPDPTPPRDGPPTIVLAVALGLAVAVAVGAGVFAVRHAPDAGGPVPVAAVPAPHADSPSCRAVLAAVPETLGDYRSAEIVAPAPAGVAAWRNDASEGSVILRCGLDRPADFVVGSALQMVDDVTWFRVAEGGLVSWYAVDRPVYLALTLPENSGAAPITELSAVIAKALPAKAIDPAPAR